MDVVSEPTFSNLNELLKESVRKFGDRTALGTHTPSGFAWTTYQDLSRLVARARGGLARLGVGHGDRVAIVSDNRLEWAVMAFASYSLGAAYVPMYQAQLSSEWKFILEDSGAKVAIGATQAIVASLDEFARELDQLEHVIALDAAPSDPRSYAAILSAGENHPTAPVSVVPDDLACLIYTSGTTGTPKGVRLSHGNIASNVRGALERFDFQHDDRSLAFLPWAHVFGQTCELYSILAAGASAAINDSVPNLLSNLTVVRPSILVAVPRIFNRIYDGVNKQMADKPKVVSKLFHDCLRLSNQRRHGGKLGRRQRLELQLGERLLFKRIRDKLGGNLRFVVSGSAALSPAVAEFIDALGIDVYEGYGLSETSPVVSANYPGHRKIGTVGLPFPGVRVVIDTAAAEESEQGEIVVYGPGVMLGYHERPEDTAAVFTEDGGFRTGDMGVFDSDGFLKITGRIKEQYKLENGKYVVPSPLEEELKLSPFIVNVMIHGANRPRNVAVVVIDRHEVEKWLARHGLSADDLTQSRDVKSLISSEIEQHSGEFKSYELVSDVVLTEEDFTAENGMLTPKMSLKRRNVLAKYESALEALY